MPRHGYGEMRGRSGDAAEGVRLVFLNEISDLRARIRGKGWDGAGDCVDSGDCGIKFWL
jgi:hypothetical protein